MTPMTPEERAAMKVIDDANRVLGQLHGLRWSTGLVAAVLAFAIGWGVSTIREQANHEVRLAQLEESTKTLKSDKESHEEFNAVSARIFNELADIKEEQVRTREASEQGIRNLNGAWSRYRSHRNGQ
jgi:hypothetical protein